MLRCHWAMALCSGIGLLVVWPCHMPAAPPAAGTTSRQARDEAMRAIPLSKIDPQQRRRIAAAVNDTTIFRRLPTQVIQCDPEFYVFLVEHPEVIVSVWRALGVSDVKLNRMANDVLRADDGAGTVGTVEMVYKDHETHVFYSEGVYDGPVLASPLRGECVLLLRTSFVREPNGRYYITCRCDSFVHLDNATLEVLAKVVQPLVGQVADHNFRESALFVGGLNEAAIKNLPAMQELAQRLRDIAPETRKQFAVLSEKVAIGAAMARTQSDASSADNEAVRSARGVRRTAPRPR
ncbi:MAG TPA: hypothetical protein VHV77_04575 [Pirellulales bacterium]|jgi:hypothetical protein|nr:hypothetical protein [Pirellulales bacterium]